MNISVELHNFRCTATGNAVAKNIQGAFFICVLALCGIIGNSILIDVYIHTTKKVLSTYFMIILGVIDLTICSIIMPMRVTFLFVPMPLPVCCLYQAIAYVAVSCSIYLFLLIAIDRYQSICRLGQPLFTVKHLKFLLINMCVSNIFIAVLSALYLQGNVNIADGNSSASVLMREHFPCYVTSMLSHPNRKWDARFIIHFSLAILFTLFMLGVSSLYVQIFKTLKQIDAFRSRFKRTIHPLMPDKPGPSIGKLEARPCYIHMFSAMSQNYLASTKTTEAKNKTEGTRSLECAGSEHSVKRIKTCENSIERVDSECAESTFCEINLSKSQQAMNELNREATINVTSSRTAWEFTIKRNNIQAGEGTDDHCHYISQNEKENKWKNSSEGFKSSNKDHFMKVGWNSSTKKKRKMHKLTSLKCKKSESHIEEDHSYSTQSIQTVAEEINIPSPSNSNSSDGKDPDAMRVWATQQSLSIPDVASISVNLQPFHNSGELFRARNQNNSPGSPIKKPSSRQSSKSGSSGSEKGVQKPEGSIISQQALLSKKILVRLFLVTLFHCLCWLPFYLIELAVVPYDSVLIQTFFMANMVNPFIHLTTSKPFRNEFMCRLRKLSKKVFPAVLRTS